MLTTIHKDLTTIERGIIAHGVNCQGVMNSGVAGQLRRTWPTIFDTYSRLEPSAELLGIVQVVTVDHERELYVANCFTQVTYGRQGRHADPQAIEQALDFVCGLATTYDNLPVYMPEIGCGLGGLSWEKEVEPIVEEVSERWPNIDICVCVLGDADVQC